MKRSFYHYIMTLRGPKISDAITKFANDLAHDSLFPKQSTDYHEVSDYLEMTTTYLENMTIFDEAWELYLEHN
ncbi:YozE family protein [Vagococcus sp. PNs007]|uniref:UPF0346 protein OL233_06725 n=1 Tax=Vagococcus proximus TaxID=2991417 RepID=A0ABT5X1V1_9ENTE|nr:YozE family protein [Vagococcus proximus]MDF0479984.1 YozE family protein [Vagococcus proximus]